MLYTTMLVIHLLCAIVFLGFVFTDVVIFPVIKKKLGVQQYELFMDTIVKRGLKIFPVAVVLLILSGGYMVTSYINSDAGVINTALQQLLLIKLFFVLLIILGVIYSIVCKLKGIQPNKLMQHFHAIVLVLGVAIVILAKFMFVV